MEIITRNDAHLKGAKTFYTGKPCKNGHLSPRYVSTSGCLACLRSFSAQFRAEHPGTVAIPSQRVHPSALDEILQVIDFYNARHGLPRAIRPEDSARIATAWETFIQKFLKQPRSRRPPLEALRAIALRDWGIKEEYATMAPLVDDWSIPGGAASLPTPLVPIALRDTQSPEQIAANEAHNAAMAAREIERRKQEMLRAAARDGYANDEKPVDHLPKTI